MTFRGFIASDIPPSPPLAALANELRRASPSLKVVGPEQLHLTLKFLGETEEGLVPEIVTAMREACAGIRPFEVVVHGTGGFPSLSRMSVVWVGVERAEPLARIAGALEASLEPLGFPPERREWRAHVTLARVKGHRDLDRVRQVLTSRQDDRFASHRIDRIYLKKSVLTPQGARYSVVETVSLVG